MTSDTPMEGSDVRLAVLAQSILRTTDPYTARHQDRVAGIAVMLGREMGMSDFQIVMLHLAGVVHDLGKIAIPVEILSKPFKLTTAEMSLIKTHVQHGVEILRSVDFYPPIVRIIELHHERLDGTGYPGGVSDLDIPIEARVLTVADVYEAMTAHRPYRPSLGYNAALDELYNGAGSRYDHDAVAALERLLGRVGSLERIDLLGE